MYTGLDSIKDTMYLVPYVMIHLIHVFYILYVFYVSCIFFWKKIQDTIIVNICTEYYQEIKK
jgi:hypothetical protein